MLLIAPELSTAAGDTVGMAARRAAEDRLPISLRKILLAAREVPQSSGKIEPELPMVGRIARSFGRN